jgi:hypothetical protein
MRNNADNRSFVDAEANYRVSNSKFPIEQLHLTTGKTLFTSRTKLLEAKLLAEAIKILNQDFQKHKRIII